jgi:ubiquinone/menaquinone biosynthesis C-methylase UbiE
MRLDAISHLWYPTRVPCPGEYSPDEIGAFIDSRELEYPSRLEDAFVTRALNLGVESGMVLDVGARVGLIALKILWQNENLVAIGLDSSGSMVERARETAAAWELNQRAVFQVGDARRMRFKASYFDLVVSDCSLHRFDDAAEVLAEIRRVLKPRGALLIRDYRRPSRLRMIGQIQRMTARCGDAMRSHFENAIQAAYTPAEIEQAIQVSGFQDAQLEETDSDFMTIRRLGETDPGSWVTAREQYL